MIVNTINKVKFINSKSRFLSGYPLESSDKIPQGFVQLNQNKSVHKHNTSVNTTITTTAEQNSCGRLSFKGGIPQAAALTGDALLKAHPIMTKVAKNKFANWFFKLAEKNVSVFDAFSALFLTCTLRPAAIMALPHKKSDNEKNKKAAAHSIASGLIGYAFALAVFAPFGKIVRKVPESAFKSAANAGTYRDVMNYASQMIMAPVKAAVTVGLIPIVDKYIISKLTSSKADKKPEVTLDVRNPYYGYSYLNFKGKVSDNKNLFFRANGVKQNVGA